MIIFFSIDIFRESGLYSELEKKTLYQNKSMLYTPNEQIKYHYESLQIKHFIGIYIIYLIGIIISMFILIWEISLSLYIINFTFNFIVTLF